MNARSLHLFLASLIFIFGFSVQANGLTLPGDNTVALSAGNQESPSICFGTNSVLAVWSDGRTNPYGLFEYETGKDIYGIRMDTSGNLLDAQPIPIVARQANQENPKAAWNGTNWLVVYESYDVGGTGYYYQKSLEAVRVSPAGAVLDAKPIKLFGLTPGGANWAVASDGSNWVVANNSTSVNTDIVAVRISSTGTLLDPPTHAMVKATYYVRSNLKLAFAAGVFFLTYDDDYVNGLFRTSAVRFDNNLNLLSSPSNLIGGPLSDLASNGNQFFAVWNQQQPNFSMAVTATRISTAGEKLDGEGKNISANFPNGAYDTIAAAWDGTNWKVTWGNNNLVRVARVSTTGSVLDPGGVPVAGPKTGFTEGTGNGGVQLVWTVFSNNNNNDVQSANITSANVAGPNRDLSLATPRQLRADIASSGNGYMMVYRSSTALQHRVLAQPLDASGNALTTEPIQLDAGDNANPPEYPNVSWNGTLYLVSWSNANGVVAQRLQPNGTKIDSAPFVVMNPGFGPADVASLGTDFLVAGRKFGYTPEIINVIAARVRGSDGVVIDTTPLVISSTFAKTPAVTDLGGQWLIAFHDNVTHDNPLASTTGAFVSTSGTVDTFPIHGGFYTTGGNGIFEVGLASNGNVALMVQSQELSSGAETDLLAHTISSSGIVGPQVILTPWLGNQYRPRVSWDGSYFIVAYQDQKNRLALLTLDQLDARSDLFAMRITEQGVIVDPQGFVFSALPTSETDPAIVSANAISLIAGSLLMNTSSLSSYRISYLLRGIGGNKWPIAVIHASTTSGDVSLPVSFDSTGSADADGSISSYLWDFGDGFTSALANPSHTFTTPGAYLTTLLVTDNLGVQTQQALMIDATAPNQLPVAVASADKTSGNAPLDVIFYADGSYDPDGFTGNLEWLFSDGGTYYGSPAYHTFYETGTFTATLRVYDSRGGIGTDTITIDVTGTNQPPIANASAVPTSGTVPLTVAFSSAGSSDPDGTIIAYYWDFGDGIGYSNLADPTYVYNYTGTYTATLTVTDNNNVSSSDTVVITVNPSSSTVMRSTAINLKATGRKNIKVNGQVVVKDANNAAVSGATVYANWKKPDASVVNQTGVTNSSGIASFSTTGGTGTYTLTVTNIVKTGYTFDAANSVLSKSITK